MYHLQAIQPIQSSGSAGTTSETSESPLPVSQQGTFETNSKSYKVILISDLPPSVLKKIISICAEGNIFEGAFPAIALVNKHFYGLYFQNLEEIDINLEYKNIPVPHLIKHIERWGDKDKLPNLRLLRLAGYERLSDIELPEFIHLLQLANLPSLILWGPNLTDRGLAHLKALTNLPSLELEDFSKITDAGLVHLEALINLRSLELSHCPNITDASLGQPDHLKIA